MGSPCFFLASRSCDVCMNILSSAADPEEAALVVPVRLTEDEVHLLMDAAGRSGRGRGRRSLSQQGSRRLEQSRDLFLLLPAFGTELFLQLRRDAGFLSEDFVIEEMRDNGTAPAKSYPGPGAAFCFYTGRVLNHTGSFATLSTCGGLVKTLQNRSLLLCVTFTLGLWATAFPPPTKAVILQLMASDKHHLFIHEMVAPILSEKE